MTWRHAQADEGNVEPGPLKHPADVGQIPDHAVPSSRPRVHVGQAHGDVRQFVGLRPHACHQRHLVPGRHQHFAQLDRELARAVAGLNLVETDSDFHVFFFGSTAAAPLSARCSQPIIRQPVREVPADQCLQVEDILPVAFGQFAPDFRGHRRRLHLVPAIESRPEGSR